MRSRTEVPNLELPELLSQLIETTHPTRIHLRDHNPWIGFDPQDREPDP